MSKSDQFFQLKNELSIYVKALGEAADIIVEQDVSNYPIFVIHKQEVEMGIPVIEKDKNGGLWNINASTLEEFVAKNLIFEEKIEDFRLNYKDPALYICIFVLSELGANFVFLKR
jgi:hypothetical protein